MMYGYGWHMGLYWFSMIGLGAVLVGAVYLLVTRHRPAQSEHREEEVLRTLDQRLASGEIDEVEYRRVRDLISERHRDQADTTSVGTR